jgi:hypothetical protein
MTKNFGLTVLAHRLDAPALNIILHKWAGSSNTHACILSLKKKKKET